LTTPDPDSDASPRDLPGFGAFLTLGMTIACTIGAFVVLGLWLDSVLGTSPICLFVGLVLGCVAATASTIVLVRRYL
jgi:F0F1-type ATP synthase assembly protein I